MRVIGIAAFVLVLIAMVGVSSPRPGVVAQTRGTPAASPAATPLTLTTVQPTTEPTAEPTAEATEAPATARIVTLVAWYRLDEAEDVLRLEPIETNANFVAGIGEPQDRQLEGQIDFDAEENDDLPRITLGESILDARPVSPDDPESTLRWTYYNDDPEVRPGTLVMQVEGTDGPYEGFIGTATLVSRALDSTGVIVIVLRPAEEE